MRSEGPAGGSHYAGLRASIILLVISYPDLTVGAISFLALRAWRGLVGAWGFEPPDPYRINAVTSHLVKRLIVPKPTNINRSGQRSHVCAV